MASSQPPSCASECILSAAENTNCVLQYSCLCKDQTYIDTFHTCAKDLCSASDFQLWIQYGIQQCEDVGIFFTTTSTANTPAATTTPGSAAQSIIYTTSVVLVSTTLTNPNGVAYATVVAEPSSNANPTAVSSSQSSGGGLSTGAKVGIAVGAVGVALIALLIALLLWRRNRKRSRAIPPETTYAHEVDATGAPYREKEVTALPAANVLLYKEPITDVFAPIELSAEQATYAEQYEPFAKVPELSEDPARVASPWNSCDARYAHQMSPSSAHTELTAVVPSEVPGSMSPVSSYAQYHPGGLAEADSRGLGHNASPDVSELDYQSLLARELSSSPATRPVVPYGPSHPSSSIAPVAVGASTGEGIGTAGPTTDGRDDAELDRMKSEIEALRAEKERIQQLQAIEERERELSRKIVQKELSRGAAGPP